MSDFDDTERFLKEMMNPTTSSKGKAQKSSDDMDNILADLNSSVGNKKKTTNMEDDLTALENDIASQYEIEYEKLDDPNVGEGEKKTYSDLEVQQLNTFISKLSTGGLEELGNAITPFSQQQPETKKPVEKNTNKWAEIEEKN